MTELSVLSTKHAWSEENSQATLQQLRREYPRYSNNELYAIWCHVNGRVPLDPTGKVILDQWQIHAVEDGQHVQPGGFKVSRPLYGRAIRAQSGTGKPKQAKRGSKQRAAEPAGVRPDGFTSPRALELAKQYDAAARIVSQLVDKRREARRVADQLVPFSKGVLIELAATSDDAADALREAGLIPS